MNKKTIALLILAIFVMSILPAVLAAPPSRILYKPVTQPKVVEKKSQAEIYKEKIASAAKHLKEVRASTNIERIGAPETKKNASVTKVNTKILPAARQIIKSDREKTAEQKRLEGLKAARMAVKVAKGQSRT